MGRFFTGRLTRRVRPGGNQFVLALLEQFDLTPEQQDFLLLRRQGVVQSLHRIFLEGELALQVGNLGPQVVGLVGHGAEVSRTEVHPELEA